MDLSKWTFTVPDYEKPEKRWVYSGFSNKSNRNNNGEKERNDF